MRVRVRRLAVPLAVVLGLLAPPAAAVTIDWVTVGDPGNAADPDTGFGAVPYTYRISKYEITNAQYAEFLNAVAADDPNGLYDTNLATRNEILRSGAAGSYTYSVPLERESRAVRYVSFHDAARFANWLHNGQPTGPQGSATTEDGAYTLTPAAIAANAVARNAHAAIFLTSEDEWYKAAYYDASSSSYFGFPTGTDVLPTCAAPGPAPNTANCWPAVVTVTPVGSYTGSQSPSGTFDQAGNVFEWTEGISGSARVRRGGDFQEIAGAFASAKGIRWDLDADLDHFSTGFRLASLSVPEPAPALLALIGALGIAAARRRPLRARSRRPKPPSARAEPALR